MLLLLHQALAEANIKESVPQHIAQSLELYHRHCDPDRETRMMLGIRQENDIRADGFLQSWAEEIIQEKIEASHCIREQYWLQQLIAFDVWPVLFVCGADHSLALHSLMLKHGVQAQLIAIDWGADWR